MNVTSATLVELLKRHRLLEDGQLAEADRLHSEGTDPITLTSRLQDRGWLSPFQVENLLNGKGEALVLGPYVLLEQLGEGGMGQVYKGMHRILKTVRAVKVIHPDCLTSRLAVERFHREIELVSRLKHPNIILAHDAGEAGGIHYFIMEYVDGVDLSKLLRLHGPLPVATACECVRQAALGLQHAFEKGLVHRDIKPSNILISREDGTVKILDMGLARLREEGTAAPKTPVDQGPLTPSGAVMGTPDYMAPEQAEDSRSVDTRADIYSLGCSLYQLLTGQLPFAGGSFVDKMIKHRFDSPRPIIEHRGDVPSEVIVAVNRMMAKAPAQRYQTPGEVAQELRPFCRPIDVAMLFPGTAGRSGPSLHSVGSGEESIPDTLTGSSLMHPNSLASMLRTDASVPRAPESNTNVIGSRCWAGQPIAPAKTVPSRPSRWLLFAALGVVVVAAGIGLGVWLRLAAVSSDTGTSSSAPVVELDTGKTTPTTPEGPPKPLPGPRVEGKGAVDANAAWDRPWPAVEELLNLEKYGAVQDVALSENGTRLALNQGEQVQLVNTATGAVLGKVDVKAHVERLPTDTRTARMLALSFDGERLLISTTSRPSREYMKLTKILWTQETDAVVLWEQRQSRVFFQGLAEMNGPQFNPRTREFAFLGRDARMFVALQLDRVLVWDTTRPDKEHSSFQPQGRGSTLAATADGKHFLVAANGLTLSSATSGDARPLAQLEGAKGLTALAVAPDNALVLALDDEGTLHAWDWPNLANATSTKPVTVPSTWSQKGWHKGLGLRLILAPQPGLTFASVGSDRSVRVARLEPRDKTYAVKELLTEPLPEGEEFRAMAFAADGQSLLICTDKRLLRRWLLQTTPGKEEKDAAGAGLLGKPPPSPPAP